MKTTRRDLRLGCALVALCLVACQKGGSGGGASSGGATPDGDDHPLVGAAAPDFDLPGARGAKRVSLASGRGKVVVVDFWATWCEPCRESFPAYQQLADRHKGKLLVIGLSEDESPDGIAKFAKQTGVRFPLAWDEGQGVSNQYQPPTMPTSYVIDADGIVRFVHAGFRGGDEAQIDSMIASAGSR